MKVFVNGESFEKDEAITISELVADLNLADREMACALNMNIIKRDEWDKTELKDGDKLEFLEFVGGG